jgi:hypothetical protein
VISLDAELFLVIITLSQGIAVQQPFLLPEHPLAITLAGAFVLVALDLELLIFDSTSAQLVSFHRAT